MFGVEAWMDLGLGGPMAIMAAASKGLGRAIAGELGGGDLPRDRGGPGENGGRIGSVGGRDVFWQAVEVGDAGATLLPRRPPRYQRGRPAV